MVLNDQKYGFVLKSDALLTLGKVRLCDTNNSLVSKKKER